MFEFYYLNWNMVPSIDLRQSNEDIVQQLVSEDEQTSQPQKNIFFLQHDIARHQIASPWRRCVSGQVCACIRVNG